MEFGGMPPDGTMMPPPPPHNGLPPHAPPEGGENPELMAANESVENYGYDHQGPQIDAEFTEIHTIMADGGDRFSVSAVSFDRQEELIWMGNQGGHLTSYYGHGMQKYSSFQVHPNHEVRQILSMDGRVLSLTRDNLRVSTKFGRRVFDYMGENVHDMQCMLMTPNSTLLMGGHQPVVLEYDLNAQQEVRQVAVNEPGCAILKFSHNFLCAGDTSGKVTLRDMNSLNVEHTLDAHSGTLSDFDVHGNQLITCGFANRMGNMIVDHFLMVYDLRMMRAIAPIQVAYDPFLLRIVPTYTDRICVVSQTGQFQLMEQGAMTPASMIMYQVQTEGATITSFDVSETNNCMIFGDAGGYLHLFTNGEDAQFNFSSTETEFPTIPQVHPPINVNDMMIPLSVIPMEYPTGGQRLLSDWPEEMTSKVYRQPRPIDPDIFRSMKVVQNVGYAPNPGTRRRNQCNYIIPSSTNDKKQRKANVPSSPLGRGKNDSDVVCNSFDIQAPDVIGCDVEVPPPMPISDDEAILPVCPIPQLLLREQLRTSIELLLKSCRSSLAQAAAAKSPPESPFSNLVAAVLRANNLGCPRELPSQIPSSIIPSLSSTSAVKLAHLLNVDPVVGGPGGVGTIQPNQLPPVWTSNIPVSPVATSVNLNHFCSGIPTPFSHDMNHRNVQHLDSSVLQSPLPAQMQVFAPFQTTPPPMTDPALFCVSGLQQATEHIAPVRLRKITRSHQMDYPAEDYIKEKRDE